MYLYLTIVSFNIQQGIFYFKILYCIQQFRFSLNFNPIIFIQQLNLPVYLTATEISYDLRQQKWVWLQFNLMLLFSKILVQPRLLHKNRQSSWTHQQIALIILILPLLLNSFLLLFLTLKRLQINYMHLQMITIKSNYQLQREKRWNKNK